MEPLGGTLVKIHFNTRSMMSYSPSLWVSLLSVLFFYPFSFFSLHSWALFGNKFLAGTHTQTQTIEGNTYIAWFDEDAAHCTKYRATLWRLWREADLL